MILLTLLGSALALPCSDPFTVEEFRELVARADEALDNDDVTTHGQTWVRMKESLPCLEEPLPKDAWAQYLLGFSIVRHATGQDWRSPLITALRIDPDIPRDYGDDDIRLFPVPAEDDGRGLELAPDEAFLLDGLVIKLAPPRLEGPHVLQMAGTPYKTRFIMDGDFPSDWLAPPPAPEPVVEPEPAVEPEPVVEPEPAVELEPTKKKRSKVLLLTGAGLGVAGTATAVAAYVAATGEREYEDEAAFSTLETVNGVGWLVAGVGGGLVGLHFVSGGKRVSAGPGGLRVSGSF